MSFANGFGFGFGGRKAAGGLPSYAPPVTDFTMAFDAELAVDQGVSVGAEIATVDDMNGTYTLADNAPASAGGTILRDSGANSKHYWECSPSIGGWLYSDSISPSAVLGGGDFTMFFVVDPRASTTNYNDIGWVPTSTSFTSPPPRNGLDGTGIFYRANGCYVQPEDDEWFNQTFLSISSNTPAIYAVRNDSIDAVSGYAAYTNSTTATGTKTGRSLNNTDMGRFRLNGDNSGGRYFYACAFWNRRLDDTEFATMMSFFGDRFGITIT